MQIKPDDDNIAAMAASGKSKSIEAKLQKLRDLIRRHDHLYHALDQPEITDREYDVLFNELLELEQAHPELVTSDSPSQRVGGAILEQFAKVAHRQPMLSLQNSYSIEDIDDLPVM